jgi:uncharacterized protein (TIGR02265 family)
MAGLGGGSAVLNQGPSSGSESFEGYDRERALAEVSRYCDIQERLTLMPPSAKVRGTYARSIDAALTEAGKFKRYRELFPRELGTLQWHPCSEFLVRLTVGGALLRGPEHVKEGMLEIGRRNALEFARSLLGRILLRLLSHDPKKLLLQGVAARRQTASYGDWQVTFPKERTAIVTMVEEYMYLESFMLGAALGTFDAIGLKVEATAELQTQFHGRHILEW